jgi:hypothetical protein
MSAQIKEPVLFEEARFHHLGDEIANFYAILGQLIGVDPHRDEWLKKFRSLEQIIVQSCFILHDDDLAAVNYCRFTLEPLIKYHEITARMRRELEDLYFGRGPKLEFKELEKNAEEFLEARENVSKAWKKDIEAGAGRKA